MKKFLRGDKILFIFILNDHHDNAGKLKNFLTNKMVLEILYNNDRKKYIKLFKQINLIIHWDR